MKKIIGIFLLVVLIAPFLGTYVWLQHEKTIVRKKVKKQLIAGLEKKELVLLEFSKEEVKNQLHWEHSKEFRYKGKMYDVVYSDRNGTVINYWCWLDKEETKLNKLLSDLVAKALGSDPIKQEKEKSLIDFTKKLFYSDHEACCASLDNNILHHHFIFSSIYNSWLVSPPSPPPQLS